jgi:hypothetical protein
MDRAASPTAKDTENEPWRDYREKRDGGVLTDQEISYFIRGYMAAEIADYHAAAVDGDLLQGHDQ